MNYARRILKYLKGTSDLKVKYSSSGETVSESFVDASFTPEMETAKSTTGYIMITYRNPILWVVKKQTIVATSSTTAEILAINDALDDLQSILELYAEVFNIQ